MTRFVVHELEGWAIHPAGGGGHGDSKPTVDITVWDTYFEPWREVATLYSGFDGAKRVGHGRLGTRRARQTGQALCDRLNAESVWEDWTTWVPDPWITCRNGHVLKPENIRVSVPGGTPRCVKCARATQRRGYWRRKAAR